jgi:hypothetical protein
MTDVDLDAIGPDGTVRLRCYLSLENSLWFAAGCHGRQGCGHSAPIGIRAAIRFVGPEATVGELARRLLGSQCGNRQVGVVVETRPTLDLVWFARPAVEILRTAAAVHRGWPSNRSVTLRAMCGLLCCPKPLAISRRLVG